MIYKRCSICGKRIPTGTQCECVEKIRKARQKDYDKNKRNRKNAAFYHSQEWIRTRDYIMSLYDGIDVYMLCKIGEVVKADVVHHIVPLEEDYDLRVTTDNLIPLSHVSHNAIHEMYNRSEEEKAEVQAILKVFMHQYRSGKC